MHSVISAELDYYNSLFSDIIDVFVTKLRLQNPAARIALNLRKYSVTPYLEKLHCKTVQYLQTEPHCVQGIKG